MGVYYVRSVIPWYYNYYLSLILPVLVRSKRFLPEGHVFLCVFAHVWCKLTRILVREVSVTAPVVGLGYLWQMDRRSILCVFKIGNCFNFRSS